MLDVIVPIKLGDTLGLECMTTKVRLTHFGDHARGSHHAIECLIYTDQVISV